MPTKSSTTNQRFVKAIFWIGDCLLWCCVLAGFAWAFGAIWFYALLPEIVRKPLAVVYLAAGIWLIRRAFRREFQSTPEAKTNRYWKRWARPALAASLPVVYLVTLLVQPTNDRQWSADQERLPVVTIEGNRATIKHFRDFQYESAADFQPRHRTLSFELDQLSSVWFIVQRFTEFHGMAHTFISFGLDTPQGKKYFSVSVEIRREQNELFSPLPGLFRHYELMYVVGSEQDLIGVRTNVRPDDRVYLFPVNANRQQARQLFLKFADRIESLRSKPEFYNTIFNNCTNNIVASARTLTEEPISSFSPRIVLPGYSDRLAFNQKLIGQPGQSFEELQIRCQIDDLARAAGITDSFSFDIRRNTGF